MKKRNIENHHLTVMFDIYFRIHWTVMRGMPESKYRNLDDEFRFFLSASSRSRDAALPLISYHPPANANANATIELNSRRFLAVSGVFLIANNLLLFD